MRIFHVRIVNLATREILEWDVSISVLGDATGVFVSVRRHVKAWGWENFPLQTTITEKTEG